MPFRIPVVVSILAATCWLSACSSPNAAAKSSAGGPPPAPVKIARAETRTVPVEITTIGNVEASSTNSVKSPIGGTLEKVYFEEGDMVREGDKLFEIDPRPYQAAVRQWEANLERDKAILAQAEANLARAQAQEAHYGKQAERYARLAEEGIFSKEQADQAEVEARSRRTSVRAELAAIDSAKAAIRADEASLSAARLNLSYCTIKALITGRTGTLLVKQGNLIKANDVELVTIHQIQPVRVVFSIPEAHLAEVRQRMGRLTVQASIPGDARPPVEGSVAFLDNAVDTATGTIRLKGTFRNTDTRLWPGQFVDVKLRLGEQRGAVVVPAAAIQTGQDGNFVYVVKSDGTVGMQPVKTGPRMNGDMAIEEGLAGGETVVTEGHLRLAPGVRVRVIS